MFDFAKYARDKGVAIAIDPYGEHTLISVSVAVETGKAYKKLDCCVHAGLEEGKEQEILDRCVARLKNEDSRHLQNIEGSKKRKELDDFWRKSKEWII